MNVETKLKLLQVIESHASQLYLTHNENLIARKILRPSVREKGRDGEGVQNLDYYINNFQAILREKFPTEYESAFS